MLETLSTHQDLQDRLRDEILRARADTGNSEDLPYEVLMNLPLLDATVREVLRLYSPIPLIVQKYAAAISTSVSLSLTFRSRSNTDMVVPVSQPFTSSNGKGEMRDVFVPKDTTIHVCITALNRSTAIWGADAKEFKPERWLSAEGPANAAILSRIPSVFSFL